MAINSHYFQRALLERVLGSVSVYKHTFPGGAIEKRNVRSIGSQRRLFTGDEEFVRELEERMNLKVENKIFEKVIKTKKEGSVVLSYNDSIILRKYLLISFLRANLSGGRDPKLKKLFTDLIDSVSNDNYKSRFESNGNHIIDFFMNDSFMKFIKHKDIPLVWPQNYFLAVPFDFRNTNIPFVKSITRGMPGYIFRIDKENSVVITNRALLEHVMSAVLLPKGGRVKSYGIRMNTISMGIWFGNENKVIWPDGTEKDAFRQNDTSKSSEEFLKEIKARDKDSFKYRYPITEMLDQDYELLVLDNMMKFIKNETIHGNEIETYFTNIKEVKKLFKKWIDIEGFVAANNPEDVIHWSQTQELKYQHKVWELMLDGQLDYIKNLFKSIEK